MAKLSINAAPTFKAEVGIPVAGGEPVNVEFVFKHRTKDAANEFLKTREGKSDAQSLLEMAVGWGFEEEFNLTTAETMLQNYMGAAVAIYRKYVEELQQAKVKN